MKATGDSCTWSIVCRGEKTTSGSSTEDRQWEQSTGSYRQHWLYLGIHSGLSSGISVGPHVGIYEVAIPALSWWVAYMAESSCDFHSRLVAALFINALADDRDSWGVGWLESISCVILSIDYQNPSSLRVTFKSKPRRHKHHHLLFLPVREIPIYLFPKCLCY